MEGCSKNKKVFWKKICKFVDFNRFETFTKVTLLDKFQIDNLVWLRYNSNHKNARFFKRENEFVWWALLKWIFEDIFVSLIRCYFYATERQKEYTKTFYYRKNVWNLVMKLSTEDLLQQNLEKCTKEHMKKECKILNLAPAKLRLVPKGETFRPIMTFNRKIPNPKFEMGRSTQTVNKKLTNSHLGLKDLKMKMLKSNMGFSVFQYDEIMRKYEDFKN